MYNTTTSLKIRENIDILIKPEEGKTPSFIRCNCTVCYEYSLDITLGQINRLIRQNQLIYNGKFSEDIVYNIQINATSHDNVSESKQNVIKNYLDRNTYKKVM